MKTPKEKKPYYIDKKEMWNELKLYNETKVISEKLGEMFLKIAQRYTTRMNFYGYSYREDMVSEAVSRMVSQVHKFDINHPSANPFSYFTQTAHNQILLFLKREKRQRETKYKYRNRIWEDLCQEEGMVQKPDQDDELNKEFNKEDDTH